MDNIEQLKLDNEKLKERLNNAAKFFREQKFQIETLTNEVKEKTSLAMDYRNQIETLTKENEKLRSTPKDEVISAEKWNALVTEKEDLNKQCNEYELKLQKLESDINSKDKAYKNLQDTYNELFNDNVLLKSSNNELEDKWNSSKEAYSELRKTYEEHMIKEKETENIIIEFKEELKQKDQKIKDLETINDTLNKHYDELENEKLAYENDYNNLAEKMKVIELDMINKDEIIKSYQNEDDNICKFNKDDINEFCDNMLDFFKNHKK